MSQAQSLDGPKEKDVNGLLEYMCAAVEILLKPRLKGVAGSRGSRSHLTQDFWCRLANI
jgi:hypothetical protein